MGGSSSKDEEKKPESSARQDIIYDQQVNSSEGGFHLVEIHLGTLGKGTLFVFFLLLAALGVLWVIRRQRHRAADKALRRRGILGGRHASRYPGGHDATVVDLHSLLQSLQDPRAQTYFNPLPALPVPTSHRPFVPMDVLAPSPSRFTEVDGGPGVGSSTDAASPPRRIPPTSSTPRGGVVGNKPFRSSEGYQEDY